MPATLNRVNSMDTVGFRRLNEADLPMLHQWLNDPYINQIFQHGRPTTLEEVKAKYLPRIRRQSPTDSFVILHNSEPIGYIQSYRWCDYVDYTQHLSLDIADGAGLDLFIASEGMRGRGLGVIAMLKFMRQVVFEGYGVPRCVITPETWNDHALRAYHKTGFRRIATVQDHPDEPCPVHLLEFDANQLWRPQAFTTEQRMALAIEILSRLQERHGDNLMVFALEGSTAKGLDRPESDLEFRAILSGDGVQHRWYPFFHRGLFVGISYNSVEEAIAQAREVSYTWPKESDALWTAKVLYDPTNLYESLRTIARDAEAQADFIQLAADALADMYEHVYKVFTADPDDGLTVSYESRSVAFWAAITVGLVNRFRYLSSRTMYAESMALASLPDRYSVTLPELLSLDTDIRRVQQHVALLWNSTESWARDHGISLEDDQLAGL